MRDIFATVVTEHVTNPDTIRRLLRHTNLTTTTRYLRGVKNRRMEAVKFLGASLGGEFSGQGGSKRAFISLSEENQSPSKVAKSLRNYKEFIGGGGRTRTADAADMSRVL